jgi:hypothetical protein
MSSPKHMDSKSSNTPSLILVQPRGRGRSTANLIDADVAVLLNLLNIPDLTTATELDSDGNCTKVTIYGKIILDDFYLKRARNAANLWRKSQKRPQTQVSYQMRGPEWTLTAVRNNSISHGTGLLQRKGSSVKSVTT